jgi:predicted dehydrogenase
MTRVLIVGLGNMGRSHAMAHHRLGSEISGLVNRSDVDLPEELRACPRFTSLDEGLQTWPGLVIIATHTESHADYAIKAMEAGAHVFVEKPLAANVADAERVAAEARALGGPYVFRMNLNQQSKGHEWEVHKALMRSTSPIVDCGVHYVDVMCQITDAKPVRVHGMGLRLSHEIAPDMYNYGQFQVMFEDGSVGWYEAGWGPMMSETAFFVKDVISPNGAVSIVESGKGASSDIDGHSKVGGILLHRPSGDRLIDTPDELSHQELCDAEQAFVLRAITEDIDLGRHMQDAVQSLRICLAADESIRMGRSVAL